MSILPMSSMGLVEVLAACMTTTAVILRMATRDASASGRHFWVLEHRRPVCPTLVQIRRNGAQAIKTKQVDV